MACIKDMQLFDLLEQNADDLVVSKFQVSTCFLGFPTAPAHNSCPEFVGSRQHDCLWPQKAGLRTDDPAIVCAAGCDLHT